MQQSQLNQARHYVERGQFRKARAAYSKALSHQPKDLDVHLEFAVLEAQSGRLDAARRLLQRARTLAPDDIAVHLNLGEVETLADNPEAASNHYRQALEIDANDADAHYGLGNSLRLRGDTAEALIHLDQAHRQSPQDPEILNALAIVLEAEEEIGRAMQCYHRAITLNPDYIDAWCNYGQLFFKEQRYEQAAQAFEGAQKRQREDLPANLLLNWSLAVSREGRYDRAIELVDRAIASGDLRDRCLFVKGVTYMRSGDFDTARKYLLEAIDLNGKQGEAYEAMSRMNQLDETSVEALKDILDDVEQSETTRSSAGFALYKVLDRAGKYDEAFEALAQANAYKASIQPFDAEKHRKLFRKSAEIYDRSFFEKHAGEGLDTEAPLFILGMPRSGTTLTEQIFAAYPYVKPCGERQDFQHLAATLPDYPENLDALPASWAREQGQRILDGMFGDATGARFATNKSPGNYGFVGLIAWIFPKARIIYCKRDPLDIGFSSFEQNFEAGLSFTYDLEAFASAYHEHTRIMDHWLDLQPVKIHTVEYEKLVSDPEPVAREMITFCGLDWDPQCLDTANVTRPIETASVWQVRQPINKGSIGKWKRYERQLKPMVDALGKA